MVYTKTFKNIDNNVKIKDDNNPNKEVIQYLRLKDIDINNSNLSSDINKSQDNTYYLDTKFGEKLSEDTTEEDSLSRDTYSDDSDNFSIDEKHFYSNIEKSPYIQFFIEFAIITHIQSSIKITNELKNFIDANIKIKKESDISMINDIEIFYCYVNDILIPICDSKNIRKEFISDLINFIKYCAELPNFFKIHKRNPDYLTFNETINEFISTHNKIFQD